MAPHIPPAPPATKCSHPLGGINFLGREVSTGDLDEEDAACCDSTMRRSTCAPASPWLASCWSCGMESLWEDWTFADGRSGEMVSVSPSPGVAVAGYGMVAVDASALIMCRFESDAELVRSDQIDALVSLLEARRRCREMV